MKKEIILILDSNSILHRAFHALPLLTDKNGQPTNAVYGFLLVFFKAVKKFQPDYIFSCFDFPAKTFRHKEFKEYKATRPPTPKDLISQIPKLKEILKVFEISILEKEGYEADDLIGTISDKFKDKDKIIITGDSDTFQLINEKTKVYFLKRGVKESVLYDSDLIEKEYGLKPSQILDFKSLVGDPSDNVVGIKGIGEKTALILIKKFGSLENLYSNLEKVQEEFNEKIKKALIKGKEMAFLAKKILEIKKDVPIVIELKDFGNYNERRVIEILKSFGFKSLIKRLAELNQKTLL